MDLHRRRVRKPTSCLCNTCSRACCPRVARRSSCRTAFCSGAARKKEIRKALLGVKEGVKGDVIEAVIRPAAEAFFTALGIPGLHPRAKQKQASMNCVTKLLHQCRCRIPAEGKNQNLASTGGH